MKNQDDYTIKPSIKRKIIFGLKVSFLLSALSVIVFALLIWIFKPHIPVVLVILAPVITISSILCGFYAGYMNYEKFYSIN